MHARMGQALDDLYELLRMAAYLKGAASKPVFQESAALFLGIAELLERRATAMTEPSEPSEPAEPAPPPPVERPRRQVNILT
jgi:hypothetical protein